MTLQKENILLRRRVRQLELELLQARKHQALGIISSGLAHEINNSLAAVSGFTELLRKKLHSLHPDIIRYAGDIIAACSQASLHVEKLRKYSRKDRPKELLVDLHDLLQEVSEILSLSIPSRFALHWDLGASHRYWKGDPVFLQGALLHVLQMTRSVLPTGGKLTIRTSNLQSNQFALDIVTADSRMDVQVLQSLLEPDTSNSESFHVLQSLFAEHGGEMQLSSIGESTWRLRLQLLLEPIEDQELKMEEETLELLHSIADSNSEGSSASSPLLWLIEDDPMVLSMLDRLASDQGMPIRVGASFSTMNEKDVPSHLLVDLHLEGEDSTQQVLRCKELWPHCRVALMSGDIPDELKEESAARGIACFDKPFDFSALRKWLSN